MEVVAGNLFNGKNSYFLNLLIEEFRRVILPVTIFVGVEIFFGLIYNMIVLYVFIKKYKKCTYRCFVIFLAAIDTISCATAMSGEIFAHMFWFDFRFPVVCNVKSFFNIFTVSADILCLLTIAIHRYKEACMPYIVQISQSVALYICVGIVMASAVIATPAAVFGTRSQFPYLYNGTIVTVTVCGHRNTKYMIFLMTATILSLLVMLLLHILIAGHFLCHNAATANQGMEYLSEERTPLFINRQDEQDAGVQVTYLRRQTIVMFTATLIFVGTIVNYLTLDFLMVKKVRKLTLHETEIYSLRLRLYFINRVINPIVYGFLDPHFQRLIMCSRKTQHGRALNANI